MNTSSWAASRVAEDYVTLVWKAYEWPDTLPSTKDLAAQLGVNPSTVSANLKKLAVEGLLNYEPYGPITLTPAGNTLAEDVVRRHRIIETYLAFELGLTWDQVHAEADRLEHAVTDLVLGKMFEALDRPERDPHGDAIPPFREPHPERVVALPSLAPGVPAKVRRISDRSPEILRYLERKGVGVGAPITLTNAAPEADTYLANVEGDAVELSGRAAAAVYVYLD